MKRSLKKLAAVMLSLSMVGSPSLTQYLSAGTVYAVEGSEQETSESGGGSTTEEPVNGGDNSENGSHDTETTDEEKTREETTGKETTGDVLTENDREGLEEISGKTELDRLLQSNGTTPDEKPTIPGTGNNPSGDENPSDSKNSDENNQPKDSEEENGLKKDEEKPSGQNPEEEKDSEEEEELDEEEFYEAAAKAFGLSAEDMPAQEEQLFGDMGYDTMLMTADAADQDDSAVVTWEDWHSEGNIAFKYTSVSGKEKTFTVTKDMKMTIYPLIFDNVQEFEGVKYYGFSILSVRIEVEKDNSTLIFYVNKFTGGNFYINGCMELNSGDKFTDSIYYNDEPFSEKSYWNPCEASDVKLVGGKYKLRISQPYGGYVASKETVKKEAAGKALIIYQSGDESLGTVPSDDAWMLYSALARTKQFKTSDIEVYEAPESTDRDLKKEIFDWIDNQAATEGLTLIAYSGHGNYNGDGTSELSLGGKNAISAVELKQHVSKLKGKVILIFDCCFSGGMIMPTGLDIGGELEEMSYEDSVRAQQELIKAAQNNADKSMKSFVTDFRNAKDDSQTKTSASSGKLEYYIYAAASSAETSIQDGNGGQLFTTIGRAIGYNRYSAEYNVFAADKNADYKVTPTEMSDFIKAGCTRAVPSVYSAGSSEPLFTYDEGIGIPAVITATSADTQNIAIGADGTINVKVKVKNHSSKKITIDAVAGNMNLDTLYSPGNVQDLINNMNSEDRNYVLYTENVNKKTIAAKSEETITFTFKAAKKDLFYGQRCIVRIGGIGDTSSDYYDVADFYTAKSNDKSGYAAAPDKKAFDVQKPASVSSAADAAKVSAIVPMEVTFDTEPTEKSGYADCTLTAEYALIDGKYTVNEKKDSLESNGSTVSPEWHEIYKNIRPSYVRNDVYSVNSETVNGSTYSYEWDVSGLANGYYAVRVTCKYSDGTENKKLTFIQKVDKTEADAANRLVNNVTIDIRDFAKYGNGFPVGEGWSDFNDRLKTVEQVSGNLQSVLNTYSKNHGANAISYEIDKWYEYKDATADSFREMKDNDTFETGHNYATELTVKLNDKNAKFADGAVISVPGHAVLMTEISKDKKSAKVWFMHVLVKSIDESQLKVYPLNGGSQLTKDSKVKAGDKIKVYVPKGYNIYTEEEWGNLREDEKAEKGKDYKVYEVLEYKEYISLYMYAASSLTADYKEDGCDCATVAFTCDLDDTKTVNAGIVGISSPDKTFYNRSAKAKLDLSGAFVSYYDKNNKKQTGVKLTDFINNNKLKIYYFKDKKYVQWNDKNLNTLGTYELYLSYNNKYTKICSIAVGYEQGSNFSIKGDLTSQKSGTAEYLSDTKKRDVVLLVNVTVQPEYNDSGIIYVTHDTAINEAGMDVHDYTKVYPDNDCRISYLIPYTGGLVQTETYELIDDDVNVPVTLKVQKDGLLITAARNGSFRIKYTGGKGGDGSDSESGSGTGRHGSASDRRDHTGRVYGTWSSETATDGRLGADGKPAKLFRYMLSNGSYAKGWLIINYNNADSWFHFDSDGYMSTGWIKDADKWYYLKESGAMATGWLQYRGSWYYLDQSGSMKTGWQLVGDKWYYLNSDGKMVTGTQIIDQKTYVFDSNGALVS